MSIGLPLIIGNTFVFPALLKQNFAMNGDAGL
jgi:hypothetical protein